ncbi:MAG TPA: hypothetical protein VJU77_08160 [Chthoniobacterales bacterium]|nr:hypothetical protein [Chthoniobacterales bacterium]
MHKTEMFFVGGPSGAGSAVRKIGPDMIESRFGTIAVKNEMHIRHDQNVNSVGFQDPDRVDD